MQGFATSARLHGSAAGGAASGVTFEYIGQTGLTAIGAVTRRTYVFTQPGARVSADRRDFPSLLHIPTLRQIR
ncbi:MAG: hypothetical protein ABI818_04465 [Acidobacteriota bacterium]